MEIVIDRKIHEDVRRDIFVETPGNGRHRCLMGIYQIGKTELVSVWIADWMEKRKKIVSETKKEKGAKSLESFPEELKVFCVPTNFKDLSLSELSKIFKEIHRKIFKSVGEKKSLYEVNDRNNYLIKTVDGFEVTIEDEEKKKAMDTIAAVITAENGDIVENIKTYMAAITKLGFHIILIFDEFNNAATSVSANPELMVGDAEQREAIFELFRELDPFLYDVEGKIEGRKYNLCILIVSRQEFGMVTGEIEKNSKDNEIYRYARMSGFTKSQIEEFVSKLKNFQGYDEIARQYNGAKELEKHMLKRCGKHPGLWGNMPRILVNVYDAKKTKNSVKREFEEKFEEYNKRFFENAVFVLKETREKVGEDIIVSAYDVYINQFINGEYCDIDKEVMEKCLELMARQGLIICCAREDSLDEIKTRWNKKERKTFFPFLEKRMHEDVYEMHSPYFKEYLKGILIAATVADVVRSSETVEKTIRDLIVSVYQIKFGANEKYQMKMLNRIEKKAFWIQSVQRGLALQLETKNGEQFVNPKKIVVDADAQAKKWEKNETPLNVLAFGEYAQFIKQYPNVFGPAFEKYVVLEGENYKFTKSFDTMMKKLGELRNARAHLDGLDDLTPKTLKKLRELCVEVTTQITQGLVIVKKRALDSNRSTINWVPQKTNQQGCAKEIPQNVIEKLLDLYDISFYCLEKKNEYAVGYITYGGNKYLARIEMQSLCRSKNETSEYYEKMIQENQCVQVDVVKYNGEGRKKYFVVCPMERSGLEIQWKMVEELEKDVQN